MRIASGGVQHETNTFSKTPTTLADFVRDSNCGEMLAGGDTIFERFRSTGSIHGGYISGAESAGFELVPLLCARAQPSGLVEEAAFETMLRWFLERLEKAKPFDGVLLDLHGAMVAEHHEDAEGAFIAAVRDVVGSTMPIVVTLDLHANITAQMAELADVIIGFDTYPHVDMSERGHEAAELIARIVKGEVTPIQEFRQLPLITLPPKQCTLRDPMQYLMERVHQMEQEPDVLTATVAMGFPFADIHDTGVSILVTTDGNADLARAKADELAGWLWELRDELQPELTTIEDVIAHVNEYPEAGLVIFADGSDNPGGGAPCDGTIALQAMIDAGFQGGAVGAPVEREAYVRVLSDGKYTYRGPMMQGVQDNLGLTATLIVGGVEVVVSSQRRQCFDAEMLRIAGVDPTGRRLLVLKSAVHFRADFGPLASRIFDADTPGIHRPDLAAFDFQKIRRPIYPLDVDVARP